MRQPRDRTNAGAKRGRGVHPWPAELTPEPGYAYRVTNLPTPYTPQGPTRRVRWRCVRLSDDRHDGHPSVLREDKPPDPAERCPRCELPFGERPVSELTEPTTERDVVFETGFETQARAWPEC